MENLPFNLFLIVTVLAAIYLVIVAINSIAKFLKVVVRGAILIVISYMVLSFLSGGLEEILSPDQQAPEREPVPEQEEKQPPLEEELSPDEEQVYEVRNYQRDRSAGRRINQKPGRGEATHGRKKIQSSVPDTITRDGRKYVLLPADKWKPSEAPRFGFQTVIDGRLYYAIPKVGSDIERRAPYLRR